MVALSRCLMVVAGVVGVEGSRIKRERSSALDAQRPSTKFIAGVPVLNYPMAYGGASLADVGSDASLEGDWVMVVKDGATDDQIEALCKKAKNGCTSTGHPSAGGVPFLAMSGTEGDVEEVIKSSPGTVRFLEPNIEWGVIPEVENDASTVAASWGLERVGAPLRPNEGSGVYIYVLDTGVHTRHQDFGGRAASALDMTTGREVECNGDVECAADRQGHGTHCAGTAAGTRFGVAPAAFVRSIKVLSDSGRGDFGWTVTGLDWIARKGGKPAVASMSLGGYGIVSSMRTATDAAVAAGITVVVAGGNSNADACGFSPAYVPSAITVGSTTNSDSRSSFSNYGKCTEIWAPGSSIISASHTSNTGTRSLSGTSMACPHVSGGAALVLEVSPTLKSPAVLQTLLDTAATDAIRGLKAGDVNKLLYVGEGGAPATPPAGQCPFYCTLCLMQVCKDGCSFC